MSKLIALDDGHGIGTPGKRTPYITEIGRSIQENEFNREVVKLLDIELRRCGFRTLLTAPTDADTPLAERVKRANNAKADLFISIHYNALDGKFDGPGKDPEGLSVHYHPGSKEGLKLAKAILNRLKAGTPQKNRGTVAQNLYVTKNTHMPAILSENGFMDNKKEALRMRDKAYHKEVAVEHAQGICDYYGKAYVPEAKPKPKPKPAAASKSLLYKVQCGAFGAKGNAVKLEEVLRKHKFDTLVVKEGHLYKVQCGAFHSKPNAEALAARLEKLGFQTYVAVYKGGK